MAKDDNPREPRGNFIRDIIDADLASGKHTQVVTRFPPEPNGYLHIGHVKSICLNFGLAASYGGRCHLRMDDTNPTTEDMEYVEAIQRDVRWLGFDWGEHLYFASDYFERLYELAVHLIREGKAYVDSLSEAEIRAYRGTVTEPGRPSPYRDRPIEESLELFRRMREGEFKEGEHVVRAKIDMASPNMKMRDPLIYRIKHQAHYRTGKKWCIYPLYDFTHCLSDSFEGITHSLCTLEFENNRELYDWILDNTPVDCHPQQIEFARLRLSYTMMSKRKLLELVEHKHVDGWDDPRLPTIAGMRRRGYTPEALRRFSELVGVAKNNSIVDIGKLEFCIRDDLNRKAPRVMCVLRPLKLVIENFPEDRVESIDAPFFPPDVGKEGTRAVPFCRELYIEQDDFMEAPTKKFFRLSPGAEVRLRYAYVIRCERVVKDERGAITELRCSYDPDTLDKNPEGRKVKGTIHWVSARHGKRCEVRLYDRLFQSEDPIGLDELNPASLVVLPDAVIEPSMATAEPLSPYQFERQGYFCRDPRGDALVFNRTVGLRDTWAKAQAKDAGRSTEEPGRPVRTRARAQAAEPPAGKEGRSRELSDEEAARALRYQEDHGLGGEEARQLATNSALAKLFAEGLDAGGAPRPLANWLVNEVARELKDGGELRFGGAAIAELVHLVDSGRISATSGKQVLAELAARGGKPADIVQARGLERIDSASLEPLVEAVMAAHAQEVARYREGKTNLMGFFVGQVMRKAGGKADAKAVSALLREKLGS